MSAANYIISSSVISNQVIHKNGMAVFAVKGGGLPGLLMAAYQQFDLQYPRFYKMDQLSKLGMIASEVLLKPGFDKTLYKPEEIGVILSNSSSSIDTDIRYYETVSAIPSPSLFVYTLPNIMIGEICIRNGFKGENAFFVFSSFNATFMEQYVSNLLNTDVMKLCICGWVELIGESYCAVLFLVQQLATGRHDLLFTTDNINKIYDIANG